MSQKISRPDAFFKQLVSTAFPEYRGRKFYFDVVSPDREMCLDSYWDSGHRDYHSFVSLTDCRTMPLPQNGTPYDGRLSGGIKSKIPDGYALVTHVYSGTTQYVRVTVNSNNAAKLLQSIN